MLHQVSIRTGKKVAFQEITAAVQDAVAASGVANGVCHVCVPHTTAAVIVNEHADPSVVDDIANRLDALVPESGDYTHREGNAPAHIKASLLGSSVTLPVADGRLALGTWQGIFFCEFDGPRERTVLIKLIAD